MNILSVLGHIGLLIHMGRDVESIVVNLIQHKENFPSKEEFILILKDACEFLGSGILSLPPEVTKTMVDAINGVIIQLGVQK